MNNYAISIKELSKKYLLGMGGGENYRALRDVITNSFSRILRLNKAKRQNSLQELWALKDVSFDIEEGRTLGIIGRNGAGKSTLLKLISRITEPTCGEIRLRGRVASLLEVGTGFHPELTGRENVFMNGSILGMTNAEIKSKFDEIVKFAEIEKFLDTPVKRYSSGMYVRLAFAVAAHLDPEIMLVDEVLAVGDAKFQKKCIDKMSQIIKSGRTILFVSHSMPNIISLCDQCLWLESGKFKMLGDTNKVVDAYLASSGSLGAEKNWALEAAPQAAGLRISSVQASNEANQASSFYSLLEPVNLETTIDIMELKGLVQVSFLVYLRGILLFSTGDIVKGRIIKKGKHKISATIPANLLNDGVYYVDVHVGLNHQTVLRTEEIISFTMTDSGEAREGHIAGWGGEIRPKLDAKVEHLGESS